MRVAEAVMSTAEAGGLKHFFGIPGGGSPLDLIEAGRRCGVEFVNVSHESSAAIAAAYYGVVKSSPGLAMGVRGVGAGNMVGGVANVYFERLPMVGICEASPNFTGACDSIQSCEQTRLFDGITKYQAMLTAEAGLEMVHQAFARARNGRPGPAMLHLPAGLSEVQEQEPAPKCSCAPAAVSEPELQQLGDFVARHPKLVVLAGADVVRGGATGELLAFAEAIEAAVLVTMDARGAFPENHPRWAGVFLGLFNPNVIESRAFQHANGVVLAGVDAMMTHSPWKLSLPVCELAASAAYPSMAAPGVRANGELRPALQRLATLRRRGFSAGEIQELRAGILPYFQRPAHARFAAQDIIAICREQLPADGLLISETGAYICMLEHLWPVERPGLYLGTSGGRTMGLTVPGALGARLADRERPMIGMGADGSLLMRLGELEVLARTGAALPLVIINDQALGTMKARQRARDLPEHGLDLHPVDFAEIARACGLNGVRVQTPEAFRRELAHAMQAERATLIDARVDPRPYQDSFSPTIGDLSHFHHA